MRESSTNQQVKKFSFHGFYIKIWLIRKGNSQTFLRIQNPIKLKFKIFYPEFEAPPLPTQHLLY